jgi:hypothetical protein
MGANMIIGGMITYLSDYLKSNGMACWDDVTNCNWLQKVID